MGVGGGNGVGVGDEVGPGAGAAVGGDLDPVAGDAGPAVAGRRAPVEPDGVRPAGGGREPGRGVRGGEQGEADVGGVAGEPGEAVGIELDASIVKEVVESEGEGFGAEVKDHETAGEGVAGADGGEGDNQIAAGERHESECAGMAAVREFAGGKGAAVVAAVVAGVARAEVIGGPGSEGGGVEDGAGDAGRGGVVGEVGGGRGGVGRVGGAGGVDGGDAVLPLAAADEAGVGVGGGGGGGGGDEVGPGVGAAVGRDLDPVASEGGASVAGGGLPGQVDGVPSAGGGGQVGRDRRRGKQGEADVGAVANGPGEAVVVEVDSSIRRGEVVVAEDKGPGAEVDGEEASVEGVHTTPPGVAEGDLQAVAREFDRCEYEFVAVVEECKGHEGADGTQAVAGVDVP